MNNFNLKYLAIAIVLLSALMIIGALVIGFINARSEKSPSLNAQPATPPTAETSQQVTGTIKSYHNNFLQKNIILNSQGRDISFSFTSSTIFYKCGNLDDINSCAKNKRDLKNASQIMVLAIGEIAKFIMYK